MITVEQRREIWRRVYLFIAIAPPHLGLAVGHTSRRSAAEFSRVLQINIIPGFDRINRYKCARDEQLTTRVYQRHQCLHCLTTTIDNQTRNATANECCRSSKMQARLSQNAE